MVVGLQSRFVKNKARKHRMDTFNIFWISDKKEEFPNIQFVMESDMDYVYDLLNRGLMTFSEVSL